MFFLLSFSFFLFLQLILPVLGIFPIIGIATQPSKGAGPNSYMFASYVKWAQSLGADVIPLKYDSLDSLKTAERVHGILLPGGSTEAKEHVPYSDFVRKIFRIALKEKIPLWGTCLGFENIIFYAHDILELHGKPIELETTDSYSVALPLKPTPEGISDSWWNDLAPKTRNMLENKPSTVNFHHYGFGVSNFQRSSASSVFKLIGTSYDSQGAEFVAMVRMKDYPVWAVQFHPEKNGFEHHMALDIVGKDLPFRSYAAIIAMNDIAADFIRAASERPRGRWGAKELEARSIDNYPSSLRLVNPFITGSVTQYDSIYSFPASEDRFTYDDGKALRGARGEDYDENDPSNLTLFYE